MELKAGIIIIEEVYIYTNTQQVHYIKLIVEPLHGEFIAHFIC